MSHDTALAQTSCQDFKTLVDQSFEILARGHK